MAPPPQLSVCLCTHEPARDRLGRVIGTLARQTLATDRWELIVVDNRSREPVAGWLDLRGLPGARVVEEPELGLTPARLRAIGEARGDLLVFVDDDNLPAPDYLERAQAIMARRPELGVIGGRCIAEFESPPKPWNRRFLPYLAVVNHGDRAIWGCHPGVLQPWYPRGAGMVVRRAAGEAWAGELAADPDPKQFGRRGESLASAEDIDLVLTTMEKGYAAGYFPELSLAHLIPARRLEFSYLQRMIYSSNYTVYRLLLARGFAGRPRPLALAWLVSLGLCLLQGDYRPATWLLEWRIAAARRNAYRDYLGRGGGGP